MNHLSNIRQIIKDIAEISQDFYIAQIISVDDADTCTIKIGDTLTVSGVGISPISGDESQTKITILPAVGSKVTVVDLSGGKLREMQIIKFSEIDSLKISSPEIIINGGENGGLININDLVAQINAIETDINNLKTAFKNWTPVAQDGGAALKSATASWSGASLTKTAVDDIQDKAFTH